MPKPDVMDADEMPVTLEITDPSLALPPAVREAEEIIAHERALAAPPATMLPRAEEWHATMAVAKEIAATPFVPTSYRGHPEAVVAAILTGRELGIGPMQALRDIHMIDGRPAFSAQLMLAKMRAGGIVIVASESTAERAWIHAKRRDTGEHGEFEFTLEDAETAGLLNKKGDSWKRYASDMLWARAVSRMARRFGSDLLGGLVYSKEEMEDWEEGGSYDAETSAYFDPGRDLLPGAYRGADALKTLHEAMIALDPTLDWTAMIVDATVFTFGKPRGELDAEQAKEFACRLSNTVCWIQERVDPGDLPLPPEETIAAGFAFGFTKDGAGVAFDLPLPQKERSELCEHDSKIPFGEDGHDDA